MAHSLSFPHRTARLPGRLDATRIGAETGAIAINAVLLMLLLAPMTPRIAGTITPHVPDVVIVKPVERRPEPPPPLPVVTRPPAPAPIPRPAPAQVPIPTPRDAPAVDVVDAQPGDIAIDPVILGHAAITDHVTGAGPEIGASLQTLASPPPPYPRDALRDRLEGTVVLDVHVDAEGRPVEVTVVTSSGHRTLDRAAQRQVLQKWRFRPALRDGRAVPALGRVPVAFVLDR